MLTALLGSRLPSSCDPCPLEHRLRPPAARRFGLARGAEPVSNGHWRPSSPSPTNVRIAIPIVRRMKAAIGSSGSAFPCEGKRRDQVPCWVGTWPGGVFMNQRFNSLPKCLALAMRMSRAHKNQLSELTSRDSLSMLTEPKAFHDRVRLAQESHRDRRETSAPFRNPAADRVCRRRRSVDSAVALCSLAVLSHSVHHRSDADILRQVKTPISTNVEAHPERPAFIRQTEPSEPNAMSNAFCECSPYSSADLGNATNPICAPRGTTPQSGRTKALARSWRIARPRCETSAI